MTFWQSALKLRTWPSWLGWLVVFAAFILGIATDAVGSNSHTVNILAPPLLLLMLWNLAVYSFIVVSPFFKSRRFKLPQLEVTDALAIARGTTVMHWAAAALATGALLAMYWRGLVFDFQAQWQSTFLSAKSAHVLISKVLSPAAWLGSFVGGSALPDLASFEQLRAPVSQGENAARWIHWYAISVFLLVLLPRSLLALWSNQKAKKLQKQVIAHAKTQKAPAATPQKNPYLKKSSSDKAASAATTTASNITSLTTPLAYKNQSVIALSLVAHTNVGKTTLARTLLGRDIGEVRNAEHVTHTAERHILVESVHGDTLERLELWDTPGFGDSELLAKRLAQAGNPIGWFLSEVWDRLQNRAFWYSQRAVRHILDDSDVVLYLINANETPEKIAYLDAELKVLDLIGKPIVVLLNQVGEFTSPEQLDTQLQRWKMRVAGVPCVKKVLLLDAFTRCWVQEGKLLDAVTKTLPTRQAELVRLKSAWDARSRACWLASMQVIAQRLSRAAVDSEIVKGASILGKLTAGNAEKDAAMQRLALRLDTDVRHSTDALIELHGLDGSASKVVLTRLAEHVALKAPKSEGKAALWGGVVTGALMGLKADILSGGLTLGGGMLAGGVLGAFGGAGLARGYNYVKGVENATLAWTPEVLDELTRSALLGYLAIAHFGRGRGAWTQVEPPAFWEERIETALAPQWGKLHALWANAAKTTPQHTQDELETILTQTSEAVLKSLYPDAEPLA